MVNQLTTLRKLSYILLVSMSLVTSSYTSSSNTIPNSENQTITRTIINNFAEIEEFYKQSRDFKTPIGTIFTIYKQDILPETSSSHEVEQPKSSRGREYERDPFRKRFLYLLMS